MLVCGVVFSFPYTTHAAPVWYVPITSNSTGTFTGINSILPTPLTSPTRAMLACVSRGTPIPTFTNLTTGCLAFFGGWNGVNANVGSNASFDSYWMSAITSMSAGLSLPSSPTTADTYYWNVQENDGTASGGGFTPNYATSVSDGYAQWNWDGAAWNGGIIPPPLGDGNTNTHVIRITSPTLFATTTSPTTIAFDILNNVTTDTLSSANGVIIQYHNINTFQIYYETEWLDNLGYVPGDNNVPTNLSTSTPSLADGKYTTTVTLVRGDEYNFPNGPALNDPSLRYFNPGTQTTFGIGNQNFVATPVFSSSSFAYASTSCAISFSGSFSLSDCLGYVLLPSQNWLANYTALPTQFGNTFPFSYMTSAQATWNTLVASSTENAPAYNFNFHNLGIGSTTAMGNILPNTQAFGASTTEAYFPPGTFNTLKALIAAIIWLSFIADAFFTVRNLIKT